MSLLTFAIEFLFSVFLPKAPHDCLFVDILRIIVLNLVSFFFADLFSTVLKFLLIKILNLSSERFCKLSHVDTAFSCLYLLLSLYVLLCSIKYYLKTITAPSYSKRTYATDITLCKDLGDKPYQELKEDTEYFQSVVNLKTNYSERHLLGSRHVTEYSLLPESILSLFRYVEAENK
ncbi:hypothetical protein BB560_005017, partial [Smittium megazygosporum]